MYLLNHSCYRDSSLRESQLSSASALFTESSAPSTHRRYSLHEEYETISLYPFCCIERAEKAVLTHSSWPIP